MMKNIICTIIVVCSFFHVEAQLITKEQALVDVKWYRDMLKFLHPSLYRYTPRNVVDSTFDELERMCRETLPDSIDASYIPSVLAQYNYFFDVHTKVFPNKFSYKTKKIFPSIVWSEDKKMFLGDNHLEILSINGVKADSIVCWLSCLQGQEANPKGNYILWTLSRQLPWCLDFHGIYPPYRIGSKTREGQDTVITLDGVSEQEAFIQRCQIATQLYAFPPEASGDIFLGGNPPYKFQIYPEDSIAIIRYNEAFRPEEYPEIDSLTHHFFQDCAHHNIQYLFFDVSRNEGGVLMSFQTFGPYLKFKRERYWRYYLERNYLKEYETDWSWFYLSIENRVDREVKPFAGQIFVYQSFCTASAASLFCSVMKATTDAVLVGTETGQGLPLTAYYKNYPFPNSDGFARISSACMLAEYPELRRDSNGYLLPDIPYPFLTDRWLDVQDCKKIITLKNNLK